MTSQPEAPDDEDLLMEDSLMPQITPNENFAQLSVLDLQLGKPDETLSFNSSLNLTQPTDSNFGWESERSRHFSNFVPPPSPPDYTSSHFEPSVFSSRPTSLYSNGTRPSSAAGEAYDDQFQHVGRHAGQLPLLDTAGNGWVGTSLDEFGHEDTTDSQKVAHHLSAIRSTISAATELSQEDLIKITESIQALADYVRVIQETRLKPTPRSPMSKKLYRCLLVCDNGSIFTRRETFHRHLEARHFARATYHCPRRDCTRSESRRDKILLHCKDKHLMKPTRSDLDRIKKDNDNPHICAICSRPTPTWVEFYNCVVNHCEIPSNETDNSENINPSVPELAPVPSISEELKVDSAQHFKSSFGSTHLWKMSPSAVARTNAEPNLQEWETMGDTHDTLLEAANEDSPSSPCLSKTHIFDQTENSSNQPQLQREEAENINSAEAFELDPVLDADAYYAKLESFEVKTADICDLSNGPTIMTITSLKEAMSARDQTRHAFEYLRSEGFCGDTISIVTEDVHIPDVAHCIRLSLDDIFWTSEQFLPSPAAAPLRERCFQADLGSTSTELILLSMYRLLTAIVKIGLLSFSGSHVCRFDQNLWGKEMDEIHVGAGLSFRPRELACLKGFIGGPVWVLGDSGNRLQQKPLRLSMMVEDIQELWGPAWLVGRSPEEGKAIRTERGYIVPLQPEKKGKGKAEEYSLPIDVECHWSNKLETPLQTEELALLSSTSRILIGTDKDASVGLVFNPRCQSSVQRRQKHVANNCTIPGACEAFFSFEDREFQIGFQSQHGPVANMTWLHKRHPMKSMKETIISGFTSNTIDDRKFLGILKLRIGLEISACTGNAQRITLWDALRLSRTDMGLPPNLKCKHAVGDLVCIKSCWTQLAKPGFLKSKSSINDQMTEDEARQMLVDSILSLRYTGINQKGNLEAYWPFVEVPTNHHILSTKFNRWFDIIHDTTRAATFAVFSQRCLEFRGGGTDGICSKLAQNIDLQSRQTCFCSQVLPRAEPPSKFRFLRSPMSSSSVPLLSPLQGVQLGGMFRVWKMSLVLERIWKGEEEAVVASASNGPLSLMSPRGIPDFEEVINSEFGLSQTVPVVICSN